LVAKQANIKKLGEEVSSTKGKKRKVQRPTCCKGNVRVAKKEGTVGECMGENDLQFLLDRSRPAERAGRKRLERGLESLEVGSRKGVTERHFGGEDSKKDQGGRLQ